MFFFGVIGIIQVLFLPGMIFISLLQYPQRIFEKFIAVIATSLVLNYGLVFLLTVCHIYIRPVLLAILVSEVGVLAWINRDWLKRPLESFFTEINLCFHDLYQKGLSFFQKREDESALAVFIRLLYSLLCLVLAYIALNWIWKLFTWNLGSSFNSFDTVAEWNRWALDWASNRLPTGSWRYPQLLSANWSLIYVLMGDTTLQFFAKSFMPLFTMFILLMMVDLSYQKKNYGYLLGTAITYLTLKKFLGAFLIEGLADMPAAFLAFAALYFLILHYQDIRDGSFLRGAVLMSMIAAGAGVTKQVGLEYLGLFYLVFFLFYLKPLFRANKRQGWKIFWITTGLMLIIVVPWYAYKQMLIWQGVENSEVGMIMDATTHTYSSTDVAFRFTNISQSMGKYFYLFALIIPFSCFVDPLMRAVNLMIALPLFLSWGFFASYDFRNLSIALPILSMSSGLNMQLVIEQVFKLFKKLPFQRIKLANVLVIFIILLLVMGYFVYPDDLLFTRHTEAVMQTFSTAINQKLEDALQDEPADFSILTNYPLDYLPGMQDKKIPTLFNDYDAYRYDLIYYGVDYLLVPNYADQQILEDVAQRIQSREFELIFEDDSWIPYQFVKVLPAK